MQRRKMGMAVVWMVCLLGMVAVVWSRPPLGSSRGTEHPTLALPAREAPNPLPQDPVLEPEPLVPVATDPVQPVQVGQPAACPSGALPAQVWVREVAGVTMTLKLNGNTLQATFQGPIDEGTAEFRLSADYHLTKDSILYGVVTSAELSSTSADPEDQMESEITARLVFDQPFSARYRLDEETLTIKEFKMGQFLEDSDAALELGKFVVGCFHPLKPSL
jgi:hypothetical protein